MNQPGPSRGHWATRVGFVLAAAGSAVGLGNIWKFPYITGVYGGGAFVFVYLACILLIGVPILLAEISLGKLTQRDPVGAMRSLAGRGSPWQVVGWMGVLSAFVILSFYSIVAGWAVAFFFRGLQGAMHMHTDPEIVRNLFTNLAGDPHEQVIWHLGFMAITVAIVAAGVRRGIERWSRLLMPLLLLLLGVLLAYSASLDGFAEGARFMFGFRPGSLTPEAVLEALGHSFFTLSIGMGAMLVYGSYLGREEGVAKPGLMIAALDTGIALVAGLVIFPVVFHFQLEPGAGPGLIFQTLPMAFHDLPGGGMAATMFFLLLSFAALTSAISLLEVAVSFVCDELGWPRRLAAVGLGSVVALVGVPSAFFGGFFGFMDTLSTNYLLPLGGLGIAVYVGRFLDRRVLDEGSLGMGTRALWLWLWLLRWLTPALVVLVFLYKVGLVRV